MFDFWKHTSQQTINALHNYFEILHFGSKNHSAFELCSYSFSKTIIISKQGLKLHSIKFYTQNFDMEQNIQFFLIHAANEMQLLDRKGTSNIEFLHIPTYSE